METTDHIISPEMDPKNFQFFKNGHDLTLEERSHYFRQFLDQLGHQGSTYGRLILSPTDRDVWIKDPFTGKKRNMLMFASNNYLGFANHPYIRKKVKKAIDQYGVGLGGPPLLNGYTRLMKELEERLAALKHQESAMVFPTGYSSNIGLISALVKKEDIVIFDELSHASFRDGLKMTRSRSEEFAHNDMKQLEKSLQESYSLAKNRFIGIEGVYSMDGDLSQLDHIVKLAKKYEAKILLDDAHGTGVLGANGAGTAEHFNCCDQIDISMGTFSKVFAITGGFLCGSRDVVDMMRFMARTYMFSAALPPVSLAAVLAGLDLIEKEPSLRDRLHSNVRYACEKLSSLRLCAPPGAGILSICVPPEIDIRRLNLEIHQRGIFLNSIEYPAVAPDQQRLRVSITAMHTEKDIDQLANVLIDCLSDINCLKR